MKTFLRMTAASLCFLIVIIFIVTISDWIPSRNSVKAGQIWVQSTTELDPFKERFFCTNYVLAVSNGYVLYYRPDFIKGGWFTNSCTSREFRSIKEKME